jgi:hypothetical protein
VQADGPDDATFGCPETAGGVAADDGDALAVAADRVGRGVVVPADEQAVTAAAAKHAAATAMTQRAALADDLTVSPFPRPARPARRREEFLYL